MSWSSQPTQPAWRPATSGGHSGRRVAIALLATAVGVFAIAAFGVGFILAGDDEPDRSPAAGTGRGTGSVGAPITPNPETVEGTLGRPVIVTGSEQPAGGEPTTIEVTLTGPEVATEVDLGNGRVGRPERDGHVYVVFQGIIEVVDGVYDFNTLHFHLVPLADVPQWREGVDTNTPHPVPGFEPSLKTTRLSAGDRISGSLVFEVPESAVDGAAVVLRSFPLPDGPAAAYWPTG